MFRGTNYEFNAVRLFRQRSVEELTAMQAAIQDDPENCNQRGNSVYVYRKVARRKLDAIAWAISFHIRLRSQLRHRGRVAAVELVGVDIAGMKATIPGVAGEVRTMQRVVWAISRRQKVLRIEWERATPDDHGFGEWYEDVAAKAVVEFAHEA